jgi:hypothetical protein
LGRRATLRQFPQQRNVAVRQGDQGMGGKLRYVGYFNYLNMITTNHALTTAGYKFQCNYMMDKKPMIKALLMDAMFDHM